MDEKKETPELRDADFSVLDSDEEKNGGNSGSNSMGEEERGSSSSSDGNANPEVLRAEIEKLRIELEGSKDKYIRALAESENFRKRVLKEKSELLKYQGENIFLDMLQIADNLEFAVKHSDTDPQKFREGVELIYKLMNDTLAKWGIRSESGIGSEFDPTKHTAISKVEVDDALPGTIVNELKKAFFYKDKLLRPGEVVVALSRNEASREIGQGPEGQALENADETEGE